MPELNFIKPVPVRDETYVEQERSVPEELQPLKKTYKQYISNDTETQYYESNRVT